MDFYAELLRAEKCSMESREELLKGLPQLTLEVKAALDWELTLEELTVAVNQLAAGQVPEIDDLPTDFLKEFWNILGPAWRSFAGVSKC